jgi:large exoprotein involved in heme utilization and adhesion
MSLLSGLVLLHALLAVSHAQLTLDGSLGPRGPLTGPNYGIDASVGQIRGGNLFHSFGTFNVPTGGSATFTGPSTGLVNLLSVEALIRQEGVSTDRDRSFRLPPFP